VLLLYPVTLGYFTFATVSVFNAAINVILLLKDSIKTADRNY